MLSAFSYVRVDVSFCFSWKIGTLFELVSACIETTTSHQHSSRANWNNKNFCYMVSWQGIMVVNNPIHIVTSYLGCGGVPLDFHSRKNTCLLQRFSAKGSSNTNREIPQKKQSCLFRTNPLKNVYPPWNPTWPQKKQKPAKGDSDWKPPLWEAICYSFGEGNQTKKKTSHRLQHRTLRRSIRGAKSKPPESLWTLNLGIHPLAPAAAGGDHCGVFLFLVCFFVCFFLLVGGFNKNPFEKIWVINLIIFPNNNRGEHEK